MGQILRRFQPPLQIADALDIAAGPGNSSIVPTDGAAGVDIHVRAVHSGGTTDSNVTVDVYRTYDGITVDSEKIDTFNVAAAAFNGSKYITRYYKTDEHENGLGWGFRLTFTRLGGDRASLIVAYARRCYEVDVVGG